MRDTRIIRERRTEIPRCKTGRGHRKGPVLRHASLWGTVRCVKLEQRSLHARKEPQLGSIDGNTD